MTDKIREAEAFAAEKHSGQVDRAGAPYIEHPMAVAASVDGEKEKIVALLHDTLEDTETTLEEIRGRFGGEVAEAVGLLTRGKDTPYMDYVRGIWKNRLARTVKMADLRHNMDLSRLPSVTEADRERVEKYREAYRLLSEAEIEH